MMNLTFRRIQIYEPIYQQQKKKEVNLTMNDDEEIFTTIPIEITWEAIEDEMYANLQKLGIDEIPSREEIEDILNLYEEAKLAVSFLDYMEDSLEATKNERLWMWFEVESLKRKKGEIKEIFGIE